ncbi:hypothetical protein ACH4L7_22905 [Streptomyces anulatus]
MSLNLLLPEPGVTALLTSWPDKPCVYEREPGELDRVITPESIDHYLETGCVPADEIAVVSNGAALRPGMSPAVFSRRPATATTCMPS